MDDPPPFPMDSAAEYDQDTKDYAKDNIQIIWYHISCILIHYFVIFYVNMSKSVPNGLVC